MARSIGRHIIYGLAGLTTAAALGLAPAITPATGATIVALGASQTAGKFVAQSEAFPAQLEALLRQKGRDVRVINAGVSGETTGVMLNSLDAAVPNGTALVIFQPGGNDARKGRGDDRAGNIAAIKQKLAARGIKVIVVENGTFRGLPRMSDGHLTAEGHRMLARSLLPRVEAAIAGR